MKNSDAEKLVLGIDDAGRGPVIGPMVLSGVLIESKLEKEFKKLGVKDSKLLTSKKREELLEQIKAKAISHETSITVPTEIDQRITSGVNLNKIEAIKSADIINKIISKHKNKKIKVIIDCPSPNTKAWKGFVLKYVENSENLDLRCEHKADTNHVVCGAASIIAKTTRDAEVEKIKQKIGIDFGSGYPSDPLTVKFLEQNFSKFRKHGIFRQSWQTVNNVKAKKEQKKLTDF